MAKGKKNSANEKFSNFTQEEIKQAIQDSGGIVTTIANKLKLHRNTINDWKEKHPWIQEEINSAKDKLKDFAESKLVENVRSGDQRAIEYLLDHQAMERGYGKKWRLQIAGDKDEPLHVTIGFPDNNRIKDDPDDE